MWNNSNMPVFSDTYNLKSLIKDPTCYKNPSKPCIDFMLTSTRFFYKENFYKKMSLKNAKTLTKMLRKPPTSNA